MQVVEAAFRYVAFRPNSVVTSLSSVKMSKTKLLDV